MGMTRARKETEIEDFKARIESSELVIVAHNTGLTVKEMTDYRRQLLAEGANFKVTKNTLAKRALKGTDYEQLGDLFTGPTGIATSQDPVAAAKITHKFAKDHKKLEIIGGAMGKILLDKAAVEQLATLPSLDELRAKIVGLLVAGPTKLVGVLQAPARQMVGVTKAYGEKGE